MEEGPNNKPGRATKQKAIIQLIVYSDFDVVLAASLISPKMNKNTKKNRMVALCSRLKFRWLAGLFGSIV